MRRRFALQFPTENLDVAEPDGIVRRLGIRRVGRRLADGDLVAGNWRRGARLAIFRCRRAAPSAAWASIAIPETAAPMTRTRPGTGRLPSGPGEFPCFTSHRSGWQCSCPILPLPTRVTVGIRSVWIPSGSPSPADSPRKCPAGTTGPRPSQRRSGSCRRAVGIFER